MNQEVLSYGQVKKEIQGRTPALLLGNGFSIAFDRSFRYRSLFQVAKEQGLSESLLPLFEKVGDGNFEGVLRLLENTRWGRTGREAWRDPTGKTLEALEEEVAQAGSDVPESTTE